MFRVHIAAEVLCLAAMPFFLGCDGFTTVSGIVIDPAGEPVPNAEVALQQNVHLVEAIQSTDDGEFFVGGVHAPGRRNLELTVEADGFKTKVLEIAPNRRHEQLEVVLLHEADHDGSSVGLKQ